MILSAISYISRSARTIYEHFFPEKCLSIETEAAANLYITDVQKIGEQLLTININHRSYVSLVERLASVCYFGGPAACDSLQQYIPLLLDIMKNPSNPRHVRLEVVKTFSTLSNNNLAMQNFLYHAGFHHLLTALITQRDKNQMLDDQFIRWCIYALYCMVLGNIPVTNLSSRNKPLQKSMLLWSSDKWDDFSHNYARKACRYLKFK